jgi:hypothetical protein
MAIIQIDCFDSEPVQALRTRLSTIFWTRIDTPAPVRSSFICEFRGEENLIAFASSLEPFSNKVFGVEIDVCGVPEGLAKVVGSVENLEARFVRFRCATGCEETVVRMF